MVSKKIFVSHVHFLCRLFRTLRILWLSLAKAPKTAWLHCSKISRPPLICLLLLIRCMKLLWIYKVGITETRSFDVSPNKLCYSIYFYLIIKTIFELRFFILKIKAFPTFPPIQARLSGISTGLTAAALSSTLYAISHRYWIVPERKCFLTPRTLIWPRTRWTWCWRRLRRWPARIQCRGQNSDLFTNI